MLDWVYTYSSQQIKNPEIIEGPPPADGGSCT